MTPVTRYLLADKCDAIDFSARLIRKVRALNFSVIVNSHSEANQTALIHALNQFELEPQLQPQSGKIAVCVNASEAIAETSNAIQHKLVQNSLLLNIGSTPLTEFSRFERYAEIHLAPQQNLAEKALWFTDRGYKLKDHVIES